MSSPAPATTGGQGVAVDLTDVSPAVVTDRSATRITGTVTNHDPAPMPGGRLRVLASGARLTSTEQVDAWAGSTASIAGAGTEVASVALPATLAPGQQVRFTVKVDDPARHSADPYGVLPVSVEAGGRALHTFLGFQRRKEYEPLALAWLVPVTIDPDPALWSGSGATRVAAWSAAVGPQSRVSRVVAAAKDTATLAIDPTLVAVPTGTDETAVRQEGAERIVTSVAGREVVVLPVDDLDLGAVVDRPELDTLSRSMVSDAAAAVDLLGGRRDIAWPVDAVWAPERGRRYAQLYGATPTVVVPSTALQTPSTAGAGLRDTAGTPLVVTDVGLSEQVAPGARPETGTEAAQAFVAHSVVTLNLSPGRPRTVVAAAPRTFDPDPAAWAAFQRAVAATPWLTRGSVGAVLEEAAAAPTTTEPSDPRTSALPVPATPVTATSARRVGALARQVDATAAIRADATAVRARWRRQVAAVLSARWRGQGKAWGQVLRATETEVGQTRRAVHVEPQTINFLADRGRVQLTVVNELPVEVAGVTVRLVPGNPRLRIDTQPDPLRIGPKSRTTVTFDATALAAGPVPLDATVTGPGGEPVGPSSVVQVRVTPTGSAVYVGLAVVAALALIGGLWRNRRRSTVLTAPSEPAGSVVSPDPDPTEPTEPIEIPKQTEEQTPHER